MKGIQPRAELYFTSFECLACVLVKGARRQTTPLKDAVNPKCREQPHNTLAFVAQVRWRHVERMYFVSEYWSVKSVIANGKGSVRLPSKLGAGFRLGAAPQMNSGDIDSMIARNEPLMVSISQQKYHDSLYAERSEPQSPTNSAARDVQVSRHTNMVAHSCNAASSPCPGLPTRHLLWSVFYRPVCLRYSQKAKPRPISPPFTAWARS